MAVYTVTSKQLVDNYAVVQTLQPQEIVIGQSVTIASVGSPFNGTFVVIGLPEYQYIGVDTQGDLLFDGTISLNNQVLYACTGSDVDRVAASGTLTYTQTCSWVSATNIEDWLGIGTATAADTTFLTQCAAAANAVCYRRRQEANYFDSLTTSPSGDVTLGTIMYGGLLYRQRGAVTDFQGFDGASIGSTVGMTPIIKQLLGVNRWAVA